MTLSMAEILVLFLALMGPTKALIIYAGLTASMAPAKQRAIAIRTVVVASVVTFVFLWAGRPIISSLHIEIPSLKIAGGIILLVFALGLVFGKGKEGEQDSGGDIATFPLAMPLIASPQGIVVLITLAAALQDAGQSTRNLYIALAITMAVNLVALFFGAKLLKYVPPAALLVVMKIAGILLSALAVQLMAWGLGDLGLIPAMAG